MAIPSQSRSATQYISSVFIEKLHYPPLFVTDYEFEVFSPLDIVLPTQVS